MAKKHHPDSSESKPSDEERFKAISAAYDILSNGSLKAQYDAARGPKSSSASNNSTAAAEAYGGFNHNYKARTRGTYTYNRQKGGFGSGAGSQSQQSYESWKESSSDHDYNYGYKDARSDGNANNWSSQSGGSYQEKYKAGSQS